MNALRLLKNAAQLMEKEPFTTKLSLDFFSTGGQWMYIWLQKLDYREERILPTARQLRLYGWGKYLLCLLVWIMAAAAIIRVNCGLLPLSVFAFYLVEVQGLFLFPVLMDQPQKAISKSISITWRIGIFNALFTVFIIAVYMLGGLFDFKNPLKKWYIGCLAVLIWYVEASSNRI